MLGTKTIEAKVDCLAADENPGVVLLKKSQPLVGVKGQIRQKVDKWAVVAADAVL
ncbi:hypothetical protein GCM10009123_13680 [Kangiella japonica]|uniref:Uncharacterized protein n=1 Tax=Kangiella japonica TaxID=647384 RepID=A0ABP3CJB6_9GAMM